MKQFADRIKVYREGNGLTQEQLAEKLFVSRQAVSKWESGRGYPSMPVLEDLSKLLNLTIDELIRSERDEPIVVETSATYGWRLKNHLAKKILLYLLPFGLALLYYWAFSLVNSYHLELNNFPDLRAYQIHLQTVSNFNAVANFIKLAVLATAVLNIILYTLTVAGIFRAIAFKIALPTINGTTLAVCLLSALITCIRQAHVALALGMMGGWLLLALSVGGIVAFFFLEATRAARETLPQKQNQGLKRLPVLLLFGAFYIVYMTVFLTAVYFDADSSVRSNLIYTYGRLAIDNGLLIIVSAIITACLYLLVLVKKMRLSVFIGLVLTINIPTLLIALILAFLSMAAVGGEIRGVYFSIGTLTAIIGYIITL